VIDRREFLATSAAVAGLRLPLDAADLPSPYPPTPSLRQLAWHELEFYGFLHFNVNTFTNREWGDGDESPAVFNPTDFDAAQIVEAARDGGIWERVGANGESAVACPGARAADGL